MLAYERLDVGPVGQSFHDHELDAFALLFRVEALAKPADLTIVPRFVFRS